jgi:hypothetical protein
MGHPAFPRQRDGPGGQACSNNCAITDVTVHSSLMERGDTLLFEEDVLRRKRRPFPGDVFYDLEDTNQLLCLDSILMP